jgi:hypothetical protein
LRLSLPPGLEGDPLSDVIPARPEEVDAAVVTHDKSAHLLIAIRREQVLARQQEKPIPADAALGNQPIQEIHMLSI